MSQQCKQTHQFFCHTSKKMKDDGYTNITNNDNDTFLSTPSTLSTHYYTIIIRIQMLRCSFCGNMFRVKKKVITSTNYVGIEKHDIVNYYDEEGLKSYIKKGYTGDTICCNECIKKYYRSIKSQDTSITSSNNTDN